MGAVVSFTLYPFALLGLQIASMMIRDINTSGVNIHIPEKYDDAAIALHIETHASHGVNGTALAGKKIPSVRLTEYDAVSHMKWLSWEVDRGGKLAPKGLIIEGLDFEARHRPNGSFVGRLPDGTPLKGNWTIVMDAANGRPAMERDVHEKSPDWEAMFNAIEDDRAGHGRDDKKARIEA